jgi:hypothetical protein
MTTKKKTTKIKKTAARGDYTDLIGGAVFIRTVSMYYTGRILEERDGVLVLEDAAWIADTSRFSVALATGKLAEVEPYPGEVRVSKGAIIDLSVWAHPLPRAME